MIIDDTKKCIEEGRCPVILTRYTAHAEALYTALQGSEAHTFLLLGNKSAKEKKQRHFISNIFVHETAWWILSQFHQNIKRRNIW